MNRPSALSRPATTVRAGHSRNNLQWEGTVPLYRYWNPVAADHFYTVTRNDAGYAYFGYSFETITGYVFP